MDIRSVVPSQLIAESGSDVIVINFGSANVRVGLATGQSPVIEPHCIAHHMRVVNEGTGGERRKKGSVAEQWPSTVSTSGARKTERDEICQMVESQLKMKPFVPDQAGTPKGDDDNWTIIQPDEDESFRWTQVMEGNPAFYVQPELAKPIIITGNAVEEEQVPISAGHSEESGKGSDEKHSIEATEDMDSKRFPPTQADEEMENLDELSKKEPKEEVADFEQQRGEAANQRDGLNFHKEMQELPEGGVELDSEMHETPDQKNVDDLDAELLRDVEKNDAYFAERSRAEAEKETVAAAEVEMKDAEEEIEGVEDESHKQKSEADPESAITKPPDRSDRDSVPEPKQEVHEGPDLEIHVEVRVEKEESLKFGSYANISQQQQSQFKYRKFICGHEALNIAVNEPYTLRRPVCRGHLNVTQNYSLQQVCDDIFSIWNWVLTEKLSLGPKAREQHSAVLVVPDTFDNREIKELISIVLRDLRFRSAVVHQECVAATFGNGISSACVVNMGAQVTSVVCVEDGVVIPTTQIVLPFGGEDLSRCFLWVQQRRHTWPPVDTNALADPMDLQILESIKNSCCTIVEGDESASTEIPYREVGKPTIVYQGIVTAVNVPVMGLFYPSLLAPEEYPSPMRPGFHIDHEDALDDSVHGEMAKKSDVAEVVPPPPTNGGAPPGPGTEEAAADDTQDVRSPEQEQSTLGLSRAIVDSILSTGRPDLQKKLFASIQLVGGTAHVKGLVDAVEERVLHDIPADEAVDTVAVLQNRTDAHITCWKGGAVLGILDFSRDSWIQQEDWVTGGVRIGSGRKYKDSYTLHSQAFYYSVTVE